MAGEEKFSDAALSLLLADLAAAAPVREYKRLEKQVEEDAELKALEEAVKEKQKEVVRAQASGQAEKTERLEVELAALREELEHSPLAERYREALQAVDELLQNIVSEIREELF